ncbi:MAG TPA: hypothetical protein VFT43_05970 [Candidatus Polarisedimenticolia bacterium]|nr:hypothetical protein [Candidatus Polarisedimenticolia bacterium]
MNGTGDDRWDKARRQLVGRWRRILERIDAHDEGGVLELANVMDEFCDEAIVLRDAAGGKDAQPERGFRTPGAAGLAGTRCLFCRGFAELGGCLGLLGEVNEAVMKGRWEAAHHLAEGYISRLESLDLSSP